jgi:hypothetical protein
MHLAESNQEIQYRVYVMYAILVFLNVVDVAYTHEAFKIGVNETNPLMAIMHQYNGIWGIVLFKGVFLLIFLPLLNFLPSYDFLRKMFYGTVVVYGLLSVYHTFGYFTYT